MTEIARAAEALAESAGRSPEDLLLQALRAHFPPVSPERQEAFEAWERASDEDMARLDEQGGQRPVVLIQNAADDLAPILEQLAR